MNTTATSNSDVTNISTILDPRFKKYAFINPVNYMRAVSFIKNQLQELLAPQPSVSASDSRSMSDSNLDKDGKKDKFKLSSNLSVASKIQSFSQAIAHLNSDIKDSILPEEIDIIKYWTEYSKCPELKTIALHYLIIPASSVPSDRVHSTAGNTVMQKRSRLDPLLVDKIIFLKHNSRFW